MSAADVDQAPTYYIYALVDPRQPDVARYFGCTGVSIEKRRKDHVAEAKFRQRHGQPKMPRHQWILDLLAEGIEVQTRSLWQVGDRATAEAIESQLSALPGIFNKPNQRGGRPIGFKEPAHLITKRSQRWHTRARLEARGIAAGWEALPSFPAPGEPLDHPRNLAAVKAELSRRAKLKYEAWLADRRRKAGYPHPELPAHHPLNKAHWRQLMGFAPKETT